MLFLEWSPPSRRLQGTPSIVQLPRSGLPPLGRTAGMCYLGRFLVGRERSSRRGWWYSGTYSRLDSRMGVRFVTAQSTRHMHYTMTCLNGDCVILVTVSVRWVSDRCQIGVRWVSDCHSSWVSDGCQIGVIPVERPQSSVPNSSPSFSSCRQIAVRWPSDGRQMMGQSWPSDPASLDRLVGTHCPSSQD